MRAIAALLAAAVLLLPPPAAADSCTVVGLPAITDGAYAECTGDGTLTYTVLGDGGETCNVVCDQGYQVAGVLPACTAAGVFAPGSASCADVDECGADNGGCAQTCTNTAGAHACSCDTGFNDISGGGCDDYDECLSAPCQNSAFCSDHLSTYGADAYGCICVAGYEGANCADDIAECDSTPCANGGFCLEATVGAYTCICASGFEGDNCAVNPDECLPSAATSFEPPCQHGGACTGAPACPQNIDCPTASAPPCSINRAPFNVPGVCRWAEWVHLQLQRGLHRHDVRN